MHESRLVGVGYLPCPVMTRTISNGLGPPYSCLEAKIAMTMVNGGVCITLVNGSTMHLPIGSIFHPTEVQEEKNGKHFFTRKENKNPGDKHRNRAAGDGFWRSTGSEVPVYYKPSGGGDDMLVGMKRTLVFYRGKSSSSY
uniref:NAC domain-containing protein n=1 Tax=Leersia perrieri TaxID=77586 RepID=A0A0D9XS54_9ORYZ